MKLHGAVALLVVSVQAFVPMQLHPQSQSQSPQQCLSLSLSLPLSPPVSTDSSRLHAERKPFITGNWKMNPTTAQEASALAKGIADSVSVDTPGDVALFVPYPFIECVQRAVGDKVIIGAEAIYPQQSGAFTAGVSAGMLKSMGVNWALAGHSERRSLFHEDDNDVNAQVKMLIANDMNVVLCIGETAEEYEKKLVRAVCETQLKKGLADVTAKNMDMVTIAYEPVWAIGTGKVATPEIAQDVHAVCRDILRDMYGASVAESTRILYGGSVNAESVDGLMAKPDIDGTLVGGASLNASGFGRIVNFVGAPTLRASDQWTNRVVA